MIEKIIRDYLNKEQSTPAYVEKQPDEKTYYLIQKTGSKKENKINTATIAIQSYATSKYEAAKLNDILISIMDLAIKENNISSVELNSDYDYTDTTTKEYRYQAVFNITYFDEEA